MPVPPRTKSSPYLGSRKRYDTLDASTDTDDLSPESRIKKESIEPFSVPADHGPKDHLHNVPTMRLLAGACVGLRKEGKGTAAKEVEKVGKICYGDAVFERATKEAGRDVLD
ncbi:hypothetical protein LTR78_001003 [Recurvomyces mirabilis]|uniref:Uncharacterized protein n=1 Tax=Recurvomyces mirabilis TaxID=574656 RepID=A0AAE0WW73_9PEZI|nr:hypothetical protein LTR78_001003 [Recurvomyces mirabilis]KAK5158975.1 hypothetical protein LTS14_003083 [Recurvomyces mirabilis]